MVGRVQDPPPKDPNALPLDVKKRYDPKPPIASLFRERVEALPG
jgi:hypothetical protein